MIDVFYAQNSKNQFLVNVRRFQAIITIKSGSLNGGHSSTGEKISEELAGPLDSGENDINLLKIDVVVHKRRIIWWMRFQLQQQAPDGIRRQARNDVPQDEEVVVKVGLFDFFEFELEVVDTVDGSIGKNLVFRHMM